MSISRVACYVLVIGMAVLQTSRSVQADEIPAWAMAFESQFEKAYNTRNLDGLKSYYAEDAQVNDWKGMKAIREGIQQEWEQDNLMCEDDLREFKIVNDYAIGDGTSGCWPKDGSPDEAIVSEWLTVWERQANGQWRVILEQWADED